MIHVNCIELTDEAMSWEFLQLKNKQEKITCL